jgi:hypothetical protein
MIIKKLSIFSNALHSEQILTGFRLLQKAGIIKIIRFEFDGSLLGEGKVFYGQPFVKAETEHNTIMFDCTDSLELPNYQWLDGQNISHYFKRSFKNTGYENQSFKIYPLGFNYLIYTRQEFGLNIAQLKSAFKQKNLVHYLGTRNKFISYFARINNSITNCNANSYGDFYDFQKKDIVVYSTRLWNPNNSRNNEERLKRELLNERRVDFVKSLKYYFRDKFVGGIFKDEFSLKVSSKDLLIDRYYRRHYTKILQQAKVGISVNGLHSAGWAIGEYCAFGLGIVCDPLTVNVPGNFVAGNNYLEATTGNEAVEAAEKLLTNHDNLLNRLVNNNYRYHFNTLSPDKLVLNALLKSMDSQ